MKRVGHCTIHSEPLARTLYNIRAREGWLCSLACEEGGQSVERHVRHPWLLLVGAHAGAYGCLWVEGVAEQAEALGTEVRLGFHFYGNNLAVGLDDKVHLGGAAVVGPVADVVKAKAVQLLHDELLGECALELSEDGIGEGQGALVEARHGRQQPDVKQEELEDGQLLIGHKGHARLFHTMADGEQSALHEPLYGGLEVLGASPLTDDAIDKLLVLLGQLRGYALPDHVKAADDGGRGVLGEVGLVVAQDVALHLANLAEVVGADSGGHGLGHATDVVIVLQVPSQPVGKERRLLPVVLAQGVEQRGFAHGEQVFLERHGVEVDEVDLAHGERDGAVQSHAQQRTGSSDMILRCILAEILQGGKSPWGGLYLVEDDECVCRDGGTGVVLQCANDALGVKVLVEQSPHGWSILEVDICVILIVLVAKLAEQPGLAHLSCPAHDERLAARTVLPRNEFLYLSSVHSCLNLGAKVAKKYQKQASSLIKV